MHIVHRVRPQCLPMMVSGSPVSSSRNLAADGSRARGRRIVDGAPLARRCAPGQRLGTSTRLARPLVPR
jgi:hypothetical protein